MGLGEAFRLPASWLAGLWSRIRSGVVQDVPVALDECERCRELECTQGRWESCERRLQGMRDACKE